MNEEPQFRTPTGLTAEQALVGSILVFPDVAWDTCGDDLPTVEDFGDGWCAQIYAHALELRERGQPSDVVNVFSHMREKVGDGIRLTDVHNLTNSCTTPYALRSIAARVRRDAQIRRIAAAAQEAAMEAMTPNGEAAHEVLARVMARMTTVGDVGAERAGFQRISELAADRIDMLGRALEGDTPLIWTTGLEPLDRMLGGGFRPGELIIVAARPSVGKSSFSMQMLVNLMLHQVKTAFLSLEMPKHQLMERILAQMGRMDLGVLRQPTAETFPDEYWTTLVDCVERLAAAEAAGSDLLIDEGTGLNQATTYNRLRAAAARGVKVVAVDYLQLIDVPNKQNRAAELGAISRMMKNAAKEFGMAIIALSQLNRDVEKRTVPRPVMSDLRDSGEIEQDADTIIFLSRVNRDEDPQDGPVQVCVEVAKQRQGVCSAFASTFNGRYQHWGVSTDPLPSATGGGRGGRGRD